MSPPQRGVCLFVLTERLPINQHRRKKKLEPGGSQIIAKNLFCCSAWFHFISPQVPGWVCLLPRLCPWQVHRPPSFPAADCSGNLPLTLPFRTSWLLRVQPREDRGRSRLTSRFSHPVNLLGWWVPASRRGYRLAHHQGAGGSLPGRGGPLR